MDLSHEAIARIAKGLAHQTLAPDQIPWDSFTEKDTKEILALTIYEMDSIRHEAYLRRDSQKRAMGLLRSFLTSEQRLDLRRRRSFLVIGSAGGRYRLWPETGAFSRLEKHGTRWFAMTRYCFHDLDRVMPEADVSLGQMLHLLSDEEGVISNANATESRSLLWNGDWLKRLAAARKARRLVAAQGEPGRTGEVLSDAA